MGSWKGYIREKWGTLRTATALLHPHLVRMRLLNAPRFRQYARPIYESYVQSLSTDVRVMAFTDMAEQLGIDLSRIQLNIPVLSGYVGLSDWERIVIATIARHYSDRPMFEIGTAAGSTTALLAENTHNTVYTLDLPDDGADDDFALTRLASDDRVHANRTRASMLRQATYADIVELLGDSATFNFCPYHDRIGLFFIDGAHSDEYVSSDTLSAALCCQDNGIVVWHDFGSSREVSRWLNHLATRGLQVFGVTGTTIAFSTDVFALRKLLSRQAA